MKTFLTDDYNSAELLGKQKVKIVRKALKADYPPNTIIVKPLLVGICRSDIKEFIGSRTTRSDFGHEIIGKVVFANFQSLLKFGDYVVYDPHVIITRSTGFSEYIVANGNYQDLERAFIKLQKGVNYHKMVFVEPMACAHHCVSRLMIYLGKRSLRKTSVAIVGAGNAGVLIGLLAKYYGATVSIFNRSDDRIDFLKKQGIFYKSNLFSFKESIQKEFDVVIPATSFLYSEVLKKSVKLLSDEGLMLLFGGTKEQDKMPESDIDVDRIRRNEKIERILYDKKYFRVAGTYGARTDDFRSVIKVLTDNPDKFPVENLVTEHITLDKLPGTLVRIAEGARMGKIIVDFRS